MNGSSSFGTSSDDNLDGRHSLADIHAGQRDAAQAERDRGRYETLPSGRVVPARSTRSDYWQAQMSAYMFSIGA